MIKIFHKVHWIVEVTRILCPLSNKRFWCLLVVAFINTNISTYHWYFNLQLAPQTVMFVAMTLTLLLWSVHLHLIVLQDLVKSQMDHAMVITCSKDFVYKLALNTNTCKTACATCELNSFLYMCSKYSKQQNNFHVWLFWGLLLFNRIPADVTNHQSYIFVFYFEACPNNCDSCTADDSDILICDTCLSGYYKNENECGGENWDIRVHIYMINFPFLMMNC